MIDKSVIITLCNVKLHVSLPRPPQEVTFRSRARQRLRIVCVKYLVSKLEGNMLGKEKMPRDHRQRFIHLFLSLCVLLYKENHIGFVVHTFCALL